MSNAHPFPAIATRYSKTNPPTKPDGWQSPYQMFCECQRLLMKDVRAKSTKPVARSIAARAIRELEAMKREIKMLPKPRPVDVVQKSRGKRSQSFSDPIERAAKNPPTKNVAQPLVSQPATPTDAGSPPPPATPATEEGEHPAQPVQSLSETG